MISDSRNTIFWVLFTLIVFATPFFTIALEEDDVGEDGSSYYFACLSVGNFDIASEDQRLLLESRLNQYLKVPVAHVVLIGSFINLYDEDSSQLLQDFFDRYPFSIFLLPTDNGSAAPYTANHSDFPEYHKYADDGYMFLGSLHNYGGEEIDDKAGRVHRNRRFLKPSRWVVGFASNVSPAMSMRLQLTLFVDDPLDYLIVDQVVGLEVPDDVFSKLPWGPTLLGIAPTLADDYLIVLEINTQGIFPVSLEAVFSENSDSPEHSTPPDSDVK